MLRTQCLVLDCWAGEPMMEGWKHVKLRDVAELNGGYAFKSSQYTEKGRLVLRTVNIRDDFSITLEGATYISEEDAPHFSKFSLKDKDTLFVMVAATLGKVGYVRSDVLPALLNQNMWVIRAIPGCIDPAFLHFCFRELSRVPLAWVSGSARSFLRRDDVRNLEFHLPPLPEQRAIAHILGTLDDKIELNRRMNETLEAMARALFKSWFVDFDPVRAKMEGRDTGLPQHIADLFPDRMVDSELGEIPEGWGVGTVSQLAERIQNGGTPKRSKPNYWERGEIPWLTSGEVRQSFILGTQNFITEEGLVKSSAKMVPERSILVALYGATAGQVSMNYQPLSTNQAVSAVIPSTGNRYFCLVSLKLGVSDLENRAVGSAQQNISKKVVEETIVLLPHIELRSAYDALVEPLCDRIFHNLDENQTLATLRDTLLPKLISGERRENLNGV